MKKLIYKTKLKSLLGLLCICLTQCYSTQWNKLPEKEASEKIPMEILDIFNAQPNSIITLEALSPATQYKYDIGEKDHLYGMDSLIFRFKKVNIQLSDKVSKGKILSHFQFIDGESNSIEIKDVDLLRLIPKIEGPDELAYAEMLEKEFNRFGYVFRKEHQEYQLNINSNYSEEVLKDINNTYRCKITNNCLSAGKWELEVTSEDYSDFKSRVKESNNLNQDKIIAHSWFNLGSELYNALINVKNPDKASIDLTIPYDSLSNLAEQVPVDFEKLRNPIKSFINTELVEVGHKNATTIKPLDREQFYKKQFGLILEGKTHNYSNVLETPVSLTQFKDQGFYSATSPKEFDFNWMKHMDSVQIETIDINGTDAYVQITLTGKWSPYNITLGNVDMALIDEQKLTGFLFGVNTYPKTRRYNPKQNTISFDADLLPNEIKPYLLLTNRTSKNWVNNQYKGIEKIYLTYESLERDILNIYVLSYERILPVWMAKVKLPRNFRETVRIRKNLYNY